MTGSAMTVQAFTTEKRIALVRLIVLFSLLPLLWWDVISPESKIALIWLTTLVTGYILGAAYALPLLRLTPRKSIFLTIDILAITAVVYFTGKISSPLLFLFYLPIVAAAVWTDLRHTVLSSLAVSAIVVWMWRQTEEGLPALGPAGYKVALFTFGSILLALYFGVLTQEARLSAVRASLNRILDEKLAEATAQLRQRLSELEVLYDLSRRLSSSTEISEVLATVAESARQAVKAPYSAVFLYEHLGGGLSLAHAQGIHAAETRTMMGACETRLAEGATEPMLVEATWGTLWTRGLCASIRVADRRVGSVCAGGGNDWAYAQTAPDALRNIADQGGITLQRAYLLEDLERLALADPVARLYSPEQFHRILRDEAKRSSQLGAPFTLLKLQIKGFGSMASRIGESTADLLLKRAASIILDSARRAEMQLGQVARGAGGTFSILLPMTSAEAARKFAAKLRERLRDDPTTARLLSASKGLDSVIGVATFPDDADTVEHLDTAVQRAFAAAEASGSAGSAGQHSR